MTPLPCPLPSARILPPTVAYAAGIVCEARPDLADGVRAAVLGDAAEADLHRMFLTCGEARDGQGSAACYGLRLLVEHAHEHSAASYLHALADILNIIPRRTAEMSIFNDDGEERDGDPTIGDVWTVGAGYAVCGLGDAWASPGQAEDGAALLLRWLREGPGARIPKPMLPGEREALCRLIPLHAHTVSLGAAARAAWAKAHLDALTPTIRPQSPDRLT